MAFASDWVSTVCMISKIATTLGPECIVTALTLATHSESGERGGERGGRVEGEGDGKVELGWGKEAPRASFEGCEDVRRGRLTLKLLTDLPQHDRCLSRTQCRRLSSLVWPMAQTLPSSVDIAVNRLGSREQWRLRTAINGSPGDALDSFWRLLASLELLCQSVVSAGRLVTAVSV